VIGRVKHIQGKCPPQNSPRSPRWGIEVQLYSFFNLGAILRVGDQRHAPTDLPPRDRVTIVYAAGWASGLVRTVAENLATTEIRIPDRPARSESLYQPSHLSPLYRFSSPGNRTPSSLLTGCDTNHYTTEDRLKPLLKKNPYLYKQVINGVERTNSGQFDVSPPSSQSTLFTSLTVIVQSPELCKGWFN